MGLVKTAIIATAGTHAVNKLAEAQNQQKQQQQQQQQASGQLHDQTRQQDPSGAATGQWVYHPQYPEYFQAHNQQYSDRAAFDAEQAIPKNQGQHAPTLLSDDAKMSPNFTPSSHPTRKPENFGVGTIGQQSSTEPKETS